MTGIELNMVITDSLAALQLYQKVFGAEPVEVTNYSKGFNEVVFTIQNNRFHLLDENPTYGLAAPTDDHIQTMWVNIVVPDIIEVYNNAIEAGFKILQQLTEQEAFGVKNAVLADPYGYIWMLHEVVREVSFAERCQIMENSMGINK